MTDVRLLRLAASQHRCVATRQLHALGYSADAIAHRVDSGWLVPVHEAVYVAGPVGDDPRTHWMAATLTTPDTALALGSAGVAYGIWDRPPPLITVVRPGSGGPDELDGLRVHRSLRLDGEISTFEGVPITSPERTAIDLAARAWPWEIERLVREAIRRELTTADALFAALRRHAGRRGVARLGVAVSRYAGIPIRRTRSDAEALALALLHEAGRAPDAHNIEIEDAEADLIWFRPRLIIELDGPSFHLDGAHDRRKQRHWERRGWTVKRLPTDDVYLHAERLVALAPPAERR